MIFQQFLGKTPEVTTCSTGTISAFGLYGNIFSICCSTGEFLLDFLKIILTVIAYRLASFTDCYPSRDAAYGAQAAAASLSSRKTSSLYIRKQLSKAPFFIAGTSTAHLKFIATFSQANIALIDKAEDNCTPQLPAETATI
jgi:hypothetical protein